MPTEDQKRDEEPRLASFVTKLLGHQRSMAKGLAEVAAQMELIATSFEATQLDVQKIYEAAYRAGREDALRWAADRIDPGPRVADVAIEADRAQTFVIDADRGTATKLRFWADQQRLGEDQDTPEGRT